jgi:hypothetical protein
MNLKPHKTEYVYANNTKKEFVLQKPLFSYEEKKDAVYNMSN